MPEPSRLLGFKQRLIQGWYTVTRGEAGRLKQGAVIVPTRVQSSQEVVDALSTRELWICPGAVKSGWVVVYCKQRATS